MKYNIYVNNLLASALSSNEDVNIKFTEEDEEVLVGLLSAPNVSGTAYFAESQGLKIVAVETIVHNGRLDMILHLGGKYVKERDDFIARLAIRQEAINNHPAAKDYWTKMDDDNNPMINSALPDSDIMRETFFHLSTFSKILANPDAYQPYLQSKQVTLTEISQSVSNLHEQLQKALKDAKEAEYPDFVFATNYDRTGTNFFDQLLNGTNLTTSASLETLEESLKALLEANKTLGNTFGQLVTPEKPDVFMQTIKRPTNPRELDELEQEFFQPTGTSGEGYWWDA